MCHLQVCKVSKCEQKHSKVCESDTASAQSHLKMWETTLKHKAFYNCEKPPARAQSHLQVQKKKVCESMQKHEKMCA